MLSKEHFPNKYAHTVIFCDARVHDLSSLSVHAVPRCRLLIRRTIDMNVTLFHHKAVANPRAVDTEARVVRVGELEAQVQLVVGAVILKQRCARRAGAQLSSSVAQLTAAFSVVVTNKRDVLS